MAKQVKTSFDKDKGYVSNNDTTGEVPVVIDVKKFAEDHYNKSVKEGKVVPKETLERITKNLNTEQSFELADYYPGVAKDTYDKFKDYLPESTAKSGQLNIKDFQKYKFENQGAGEIVANSFGKLATNIVPQILSSAAAMVDIPGYWDAEHAANNGIVKWANDVKQWSDDAFHTQENPDDPHDFTSMAWWANRGESLVESIAAFAVTGMGAGALVKGIGASIKAAGGAKALAKAITLGGAEGRTAWNATRAIGGAGETLGTAVMMNQAEAVMEASQVYDDVYNEHLAKGYSYEASKKLAASAAATTMSVNRWNIALNLTSAKMFTSALGTKKELLKELTKATTLKEMGRESIQEAGEELVNHIATQKGKSTADLKNYTMEDLLKDVTSAEGLEAAFLGALGGGVQTGVVGALKGSKYGFGSSIDEAGNRVSANDQYRQQYAKQQEFIKDLKDKGVKFSDAMMNTTNFQKYIKDLSTATTEEEKQAVIDKSFALNTAKNAFDLGTQEVLYSQFDDIIKNPDSTQEEKENAIAARKHLGDLEHIHNNYQGYENKEELYVNKANQYLLEKQVNSSKENALASKLEIEKEAEVLAKKYTLLEEDYFLKGDEKGPVRIDREPKKVPFAYSIENLENNPYEGQTGPVAEHNKQVWDSFTKEVKASPMYERYANYNKQFEIFEETLRDFKKDEEYLKSDKGQKEAVTKKEEREKVKEQLNEIQKTDNKAVLSKYVEEGSDIVKQIAKQKLKDLKLAEDNAILEKKRQKEKTQFLNKINSSTVDTLRVVEAEIAESSFVEDEEIQQAIEAHKEFLANPGGLPSGFSQVLEVENTPDNDIAQKENDDELKKPKDYHSEQEQESYYQEVQQKVLDKAAEENKGANSKIFDYLKPKVGHDRLAFLNRAYKQFYDILSGAFKREEITDEIKNHHVLSKNAFGKNSKITFSLQEDYEGPTYNPNSDTKETYDWQSRLEEIKVLAKKKGMPYQETAEYIAEVPIVGKDDQGNEVWLHVTSWITSENLSEENDNLIEEDRKTLYNMRKNIIAKGSISTKVSFKGKGVLLKTHKDKPISASEAFPEGSSTTVVFKDGKAYDLNNKVVKTDLVLKDGYVAQVVKDDYGTVAPLRKGTLTDQDVTTIEQAITLWALPASQYNEQQTKAADEIKKAIGVDLKNNKTAASISPFLDRFIYTFKGKDKKEVLGILQNTKINSKNLIVIVEGNNLQIGIPATKNGTVSLGKIYTVSPNFYKNNNKELVKSISRFIENLRNDYIINVSNKATATISISEDLEVNSIPYDNWVKERTTSNIYTVNVGTEENPQWSAHIQPTILFETAPLLQAPKIEKQTTTSQSIKQTVNEVEVKKADIELQIATLENQKGEPVKEPNFKGEVQYFRMPDSNGNFKDSQAGKQFEPTMTMVKIVINENNPNEGSIEYRGNSTVDASQSNHPDNGISLFANFADKRTGTREIKNIRKGLVEKTADGWKVTQKPVIVFGEVTDKIKQEYLNKKVDNTKEIEKLKQELKALEQSTSKESLQVVDRETTDLETLLANSRKQDVQDLIDTYSKVELLQQQQEAINNNDVDKTALLQEALNTLDTQEDIATQNDEIVNPETGKPIELDDSELDLMPSTAINYDAILAESENLLLKGVPVQVQYDLVRWITSRLVKATVSHYKKTGSRKLNVEPVYNELYKQIENILKSASHPKRIEVLTNILAQKDFTKDLVKQYVELISSSKLEVDSLEDDTETGMQEKTNYSDEFNLTLDSKTTSSGNLRKFFSSILELDENYEPKVNAYGIPLVKGIDEVYDTLHEQLVNLPADYKKLIAKLEEKQEVFPWFKEVINLLENNTEDIQNEFVSDMTKHHVDMEFVLWNIDDKGKVYARIYNSNSASKEQRIKELWANQFENAPNDLIILNDDNESIINPIRAKELLNDLKETTEIWKTLNSEDQKNFLVKWLGGVGITLSDATYKQLERSKFMTYSKSYLSHNSFLSSASSPISAIKKMLITAQAGSGDIKNALTVEEVLKSSSSTLFNNSSLKSLAKMEASNSGNAFSNSFKSGLKTIYSYGNNKWIVNRLRSIIEDKDLLQDLSKLSYNKESKWLSLLLGDPTSETTQKFYETLKFNYLGLEALKREGTTSRDNKKLNQISETEHEFVKISNFFNKFTEEKIDGQSFREAAYFYPTTSDKTGTYTITAIAKSVKYDYDEQNEQYQFSKEDVDYFYEAVILPEIARIQSDVQPENIDGVNTQVFYHIPVLNTPIAGSVLLSEINILERVINKEEGTTELIKDWLTKEFLPSIVNEQIKDWRNLGIVYNNENKELSSYLNTSYLKTKNGTAEQKIATAAAEYVFNYMVANAEMFKLFIGDPAQFWKKSKTGDTVLDHVEETLINIGKRLAADVAPGIELADSENTFYTQVFLEDAKFKSENLYDEYQKKFFTAINPGYEKDYSNIDGTDAQEYETWQERLHVLHKLGRLSLKQKDILSKKLKSQSAEGVNKTNELSYDELQTVLQPMKPVYAGNILQTENNLDRRVYVKSASFPLIPQLTQRLQIDSLRKALEKYESQTNDAKGNPLRTVRAAFGSATKVGGSKAKVTVFDKEGNLVPNVTIENTNVIDLPRANFRIQQDVPYDRNKTTVSMGSQVTKLMFLDILGIKGFNLKGQPNALTGKELESIYLDTFDKLFKSKQDSLSKELGLIEEVEELKNLDLGKEKNSIFGKSKRVNTEEVERTNYINENFDIIVQELLKAKIDIISGTQLDFDKKC